MAVPAVIAGLELSSAFIDQDLFSVPILLKWGVGWLREAGELVEA